jgi:hypothetical protein
MDVDQNSTQIYGKATFDREYPASARTGETSRAFCNSPVHKQCGCFTSQFWWGDVRQHWQRNLWKIILQLQSINQLFAKKGKEALQSGQGIVQLQCKKKSKTKDICFKDTAH